MIKINVYITFRQYAKLIFSLIYKKPMMKLIVGVGIAMLIWILGYNFHIGHLPKPLFYQYTTLVLIAIAQPLVIFTTVWKNYHSANHLMEPVEMEFNHTKIVLKGRSFYTEMAWDKMYKTAETPNWFLLYQNSLSAVLVPKKSLLGSQIKDFRTLLDALKKKLR